MRKIFIITTIVLILFSCGNEGMEKENGKNEKHYVTISYHSEGHTEGEVPVDDNRYELKNYDYTTFTGGGARVFIHGAGTLKKEGYYFDGWSFYHADNNYHGYFTEDFTERFHNISLGYEIHENDIHLELHASWGMIY